VDNPSARLSDPLSRDEGTFQSQDAIVSLYFCPTVSKTYI
jgi:hypothetical protein